MPAKRALSAALALLLAVSFAAPSGARADSADGFEYFVTGSTATVTLSHAGLSAAQTQTLVEGLAYRYAASGGMTRDHVVTLTEITDSGSDNNVRINLALASTVLD